MPYASYRLGGGLNTGADETTIRDDQLSRARGCDFEKRGACSSGKGRTLLQDDALAGGAINGHFDAALNSTKKRYTKSGTTVYEDFLTDIGTFSGAGSLTGFGYNNYVYLADGTSGMKRWDGTTLIDAGLDAPGYYELAEDPILTTSSSTSVVVTLPAGHTYEVGQSFFMSGAEAVGSIPTTATSSDDGLNGSHVITAVNTGGSNITFALSANAGSTIQGGGPYVTVVGQWSGHSGRTLGLIPGQMPVGGVYKYAYTFYNGVAESNFTEPVTITIDSGDDSVFMDDVMRRPTGAFTVRFYRSDINGEALYFMGERTKDNEGSVIGFTDYNAAPTFSMDAAGSAVVDSRKNTKPNDSIRARKQENYRPIRDLYNAARTKGSSSREDPEVVPTNLGLLAAWSDHDPPPANAKHLGMHQEQVFLISGNKLQFSLLGQPEHFSPYNAIEPGRNTGEDLLTWVPFDRDVICYTNRGLYRFSQVGEPTALLEEIESPVGLAGEWAVAALDGANGHLFLAPSGLYLFDGDSVSQFDLPLLDLFDDADHEDYINPSLMSTARMAVKGRKVFLSYGNAAAGDRMLIGDFEDLQDIKWSTSTVAVSTIVREREGDVLICGDSSGNLYEMGVGTADGTADIVWAPTTKEYGLGDDDIFFALDKLVLDIDLGGTSTTVTVTTDGRAATKTYSFTLTGSGRQRYTKMLPVYLKGETVKVALSSSSTTTRRWYKVGFMYNPMGAP